MTHPLLSLAAMTSPSILLRSGNRLPLSPKTIHGCCHAGTISIFDGLSPLFSNQSTIPFMSEDGLPDTVAIVEHTKRVLALSKLTYKLGLITRLP
jgi:hypothetical protein